MPENIEDDNVVRLLTEIHSMTHRLTYLVRERERNQRMLNDADQIYFELLERVAEITQHLHGCTGELNRVSHERAGRTHELQEISRRVKEEADGIRHLERKLDRVVRRDPCPRCGSRNVVPIIYGEPDIISDIELLCAPFIVGGSSVNIDETVACDECGTRFRSE